MNNKGMTITEIIISISLVSIVLVFLFNIIITVNDSNAKMQNESTLLINKGVIVREIENDFINLQLNEVKACDNETDFIINDLYNRVFPPGVIPSEVFCLKFNYNLINETGFLVYYKNNGGTENILGYLRGSKKILRYTKVAPSHTGGKIKTECFEEKCLLNIIMPVMGENAENYNIDLSYYYQSGTVNIQPNVWTSEKYGFKIA